jgi:hypothetical protein
MVIEPGLARARLRYESYWSAGGGESGGLLVISFETWRTGFIVTIEGNRIVWHSMRTPSIFAGRAVRRGGKNSIKWVPLGKFKVINEGPDSTVLKFDEGISLVFRYTDRIFHIATRVIDPEIEGLKIIMGAKKEERLFGLGPSNQFDIKGKSLTITAGEPEESAYNDAQSTRIPVFFSDAGRWLWIKHDGGLSLSFDAKATTIESAGIPQEFVIGFARNLQEGFALLDKTRSKELGSIRVSTHRIHLCDEDVITTEKLAVNLLSLSFSGIGIPGVLLNPDGAKEGKLARWAHLADLRLFSSSGIENDTIEWMKDHGMNPRFARRNEEIVRVMEAYQTAAEGDWRENGIPVLCHPAVYYSNEPSLWEYCAEYMYGRDVLMAPSMDDMTRERSLYLPNDTWVHLWTSRRYGAGKVTVDAPAGRPAVFYRAASEFAGLFEAIRQMAVRLW